MTDAAPTPRPPTTRHTMRSITPNASPDPIEDIRNSTAAISITGMRPSLLASPPANQAPTTQPSSAEETAKPDSPAPSENWSVSASTAPLMTAVSKPNRKPPSAAAMQMPMTRALSLGGADASMPIPSPGRGPGRPVAAGTTNLAPDPPGGAENAHHRPHETSPPVPGQRDATSRTNIRQR